MKKVIIALGGNALQANNIPATAENQLKVVESTAERIADIIEVGYSVTLTHGNGPQVGRILLQNEYAAAETPAMPFDVCGAMSQGMIGYHIQQGLKKILQRRGIDKDVVSVVTQVVVDKNDAGFSNPTKPIGPFYSQEEAQAVSAEKGYIVKEDSGRGWRRVVASPLPLEIIELKAVKALTEAGFIVVTVGGGGIPVVKNDKGELEGVAAVIDKDFASAKLGVDMGADVLMILTGVEKVCLNYGKPDQKTLDRIDIQEAEEYIAQGHFAPGSMLPKIQAAIDFVRGGNGRESVITSLDNALAALEGRTGTVIVK